MEQPELGTICGFDLSKRLEISLSHHLYLLGMEGLICSTGTHTHTNNKSSDRMHETP